MERNEPREGAPSIGEGAVFVTNAVRMDNRRGQRLDRIARRCAKLASINYSVATWLGGLALGLAFGGMFVASLTAGVGAVLVYVIADRWQHAQIRALQAFKHHMQHTMQRSLNGGR